MSVQEPPQFSPAQVLEAARRAESEGRTEYAIQFYRHLVDYYPSTGEAAAAQSALGRVGRNTQNGANGHRRPPPPPPVQQQPQPAHAPPLQPLAQQVPGAPSAFEMPRLDPPQIGAGLGNPFGNPHAPEPVFAPQQQPASIAAPRSEHPEAMTPPVDLPPAPRDYRTGRILARLFSWLGGVEVLMGLVLLPLAVLNPRMLTSLPLLGGPLAGPATGASLIVAGLLQVMFGQLVRAVLDHANATRDLAAMARAEAEARQGAVSTRSRRR